MTVSVGPCQPSCRCSPESRDRVAVLCYVRADACGDYSSAAAPLTHRGRPCAMLHAFGVWAKQEARFQPSDRRSRARIERAHAASALRLPQDALCAPYRAHACRFSVPPQAAPAARCSARCARPTPRSPCCSGGCRRAPSTCQVGPGRAIRSNQKQSEAIGSNHLWQPEVTRHVRKPAESPARTCMQALGTARALSARGGGTRRAEACAACEACARRYQSGRRPCRSW